MKFDIFRDIFELTDMKIVYFQSGSLWSMILWFGHDVFHPDLVMIFTNLISLSKSYMSEFIFESIMDDVCQNGIYEYYCSI